MKLSEAKFVVLDTETTGLDPATDQVVDIALVPVVGNEIGTPYESLVNPGMPIPPESSAVHHIVDEDVQGAPSIDSVRREIESIVYGAVIVAHNAKFDSSMFPLPNPWLCTYRLARHLWPDEPQHNNQYLRYRFGLRLPGMSVHRAKGDAMVTAHLLHLMISEYLIRGYADDVSSLVTLASSPILVRTMPFGKHKRMPMQDVPRDYLAWALRNINDMDPDLRATMQHYLDAEIIA